MSAPDNLWLMLYKAYNRYLAIRMEVFASPYFDEQISKALLAPEGRRLALNTLNNVMPSRIGKHAAEVFKEATSEYGDTQLARAVLSRLHVDEAANILRPLVHAAAKGNQKAVVDTLMNLGQEAMADEVMTGAAATVGAESDRSLDVSANSDSRAISESLPHMQEADKLPEMWEQELEAEQAFRSIRARFMKDPRLGEYLGEGLRSFHGRRLVLEVMFDLPVVFTIIHIAEIFDDATSTHGNVDVSRDLLARLEFDEATAILRPMVEERLATDDETWEGYLRSAEVLGELGQTDLLDYVVARARTSDDPDVLVTAELFDGGSFTRLDRVTLRAKSQRFDFS